MNAKKRMVLNYGELSDELKSLVSKKFPNGFKNALMSIPKSDGTSYNAFTIDTGDVLYLIKVEDQYLKTADELIKEVEDFVPEDSDFEF